MTLPLETSRSEHSEAHVIRPDSWDPATPFSHLIRPDSWDPAACAVLACFAENGARNGLCERGREGVGVAGGENSELRGGERSQAEKVLGELSREFWGIKLMGIRLRLA